MPAIARYLTADALRGWLFRTDVADIADKTEAEIFAANGYVPESAELIAVYDETAERYFDWRGQYGAQFSGQGTAFYAEDPTATHRDTDWSRKGVVVLSSRGGSTRPVNDEGILNARTTTLEATGDILGQYLRKAAKSNHYNAEDEVSESRDAIPKGLFTQLPVHPYVFMFHLELHHDLWMHVDDLAPYEYQPTLKQKLILAPEQTDLIDILTAEVCSEIIQRPLYRVHSGQPGLNVAAMETALKDILTRAQRWGAVMLIDEAFVSHCIALIRYDPPDSESRRRTWQVMLEQFAPDVDDALLDELVELFPDASGRDIKGLAKLTAKYCSQKQVRPSTEVFRRCSVFRGMELERPDKRLCSA